MADVPLISVITPSYNRAGFIQTAIESVLAQNYSSFEHVIVDGGSTDGTLQLLSSYSHLKVISEPDMGVYDALNKGIALAHGEIIAQLNSDDKYEPEIFATVADLFINNSNIEAVSAGARIFEVVSAGEKTIAEYAGVGEAELAYRATLGVPVFNGWFFRKEVFQRIGSYSLEYPLIADRDFLIRCYSGKVNHMHVDNIFYHYCQHPQSLTINGRQELRDPVYKEVLKLTNIYINSSSDLVIKDLCSKWQDYAAIELFISAVRRRKLLDVFEIVFAAIRKNLKWPLSLMVGVLIRIKDSIKKKYVNKS